MLESKSATDYVPNLSSLAQQGYGLVIAVGFLMTDSVDQVAKQFPNTKFAIVDVDATSMADKPTNVQGILFKEQESGYLAGYLAGLVMKAKGGPQVAGTVGGLKIPPVDRYIAGFKAGLKKADPAATELNGYSQDFVDQAKCKEVALQQIAQGSHGRVPGCRRLWPRRPRRGEGEGDLGDRRRQRPVVPRRAHPHERDQEGRPGRLPDDPGGPEGHLQGRHEPRLRCQAGRLGHRQDQPEGQQGDPGQGARGPGHRSRPGRSRTSRRSFRSQTVLPEGRAQARPSGTFSRRRPRVIESRGCPTPLRSSSSARSRSASPACSRTTGSTSTSCPAKCMRCSARTAPASRR